MAGVRGPGAQSRSDGLQPPPRRAKAAVEIARALALEPDLPPARRAGSRREIKNPKETMDLDALIARMDNQMGKTILLIERADIGTRDGHIGDHLGAELWGKDRRREALGGTG